MRLITALIILLSMTGAVDSGNQECDCRRAKSSDVTRHGGNSWIAYSTEGTFKTIAGTVLDPNATPMDGTLVEVFDKPDYLLCEWENNNPNGCTTTPPEKQRRKAACRPGKDGKFCFNQLPAGSYELRVSKDGQWNVVHTLVIVNPKDGGSKDGGIEIMMSVGG